MITISILVTVSLSFLVTLTFPVLSALLFRLFNWIRNKRNLPDITNKTVSDIFFDKTSSFPMFIFSIPDGKLISKGYRGQKSGLHEDFSVINYNLYEETGFVKNDTTFVLTNVTDYQNGKKHEINKVYKFKRMDNFPQIENYILKNKKKFNKN